MAKTGEAKETTAVQRFPSAKSDAKKFPAPQEGFIVTHLLIITDQDRSRDFCSRVLGGEMIHERDPAVGRLRNGWLNFNSGGGPTEDKPELIAALSLFPYLRVVASRSCP